MTKKTTAIAFTEIYIYTYILSTPMNIKQCICTYMFLYFTDLIQTGLFYLTKITLNYALLQVSQDLQSYIFRMAHNLFLRCFVFWILFHLIKHRFSEQILTEIGLSKHKCVKESSWVGKIKSLPIPRTTLRGGGGGRAFQGPLGVMF